MTPVVGWVQSLTGPLSAIGMFGMLKLIQGVLRDETSYRLTVTRKDMGTIIVDNQLFEDRILNGQLPTASANI